MSEITPTRSAFLELREEREGMDEGYRFLDEKRLVLAAETLQELARYEAAWAAFRDRYREAAAALRGAVVRHGLNGLEHYPPLPPGWTDLRRHRRSVLGVTVQDVELETTQAEQEAPAVNPSPEAEACRLAFARLIPLAAGLAAMAGNLQRLRLEYERTSRRARALEDVLLPELDQALSQLDTALEDLDKEEIVRVEYFRRNF